MERVLRGSGKVLRLYGRQRPLSAARGIDREVHGALKQRRRGGLPAARPRTSRRTLEFIRDGLVRTRRGERAMPRSPIGISVGARRLGDRRMN